MTPIRLATTQDVIEIATMSRDLIETGLGWSWDAPRVVRSVRDMDTVVAVVDVEEPQATNLISGFAIMVFRQHTAHLNLLAVRAEYQRHSIGRDLVQWLEKSALVAGTFQLSLEVRATNNGAQAFYRRLGYGSEQMLKGYYQKRESAIRMTKNISVLENSANAP